VPGKICCKHTIKTKAFSPKCVICPAKPKNLAADLLGTHFSREAKERYHPAVGLFTPVSLFVHEDDHPSSPILRCPSRAE